jgi:hypothetical protein
VFDHLREAGPVICEMEWTPGLEYLRKIKFILFTYIGFLLFLLIFLKLYVGFRIQGGG